MGTNQSKNEADPDIEKPDPSVNATLYYFEGRGKADQIRWMLAATNTTFIQKHITSRERFLKMQKQLVFGTLPLLQIDGVELVQSQPIVRYLANRGGLAGKTPTDEVKCDMIADAVLDLVSIAYSSPFRKCLSDEDGARNQQLMEERWDTIGSKLESLLASNGGKFMVGNAMTYTDILVAHCVTWYVEECGPAILSKMPLLVDLQCLVISLPQIKKFIQSPQYFSVSGESYVIQVSEVMGLPLPVNFLNRLQGKRV